MPAIDTIQLRPAIIADARRVFDWRNDPWIVERSTSQRSVAWEEHLAWFERSLAAMDERLILIVEHDGESIGLVRFDRESSETCVISTYLLQPFTGKGLGIGAIRQGYQAAFDRWPEMQHVIACVRRENAPGRSAFEKAGFTRSENSLACPEGHVTFVLSHAHA